MPHTLKEERLSTSIYTPRAALSDTKLVSFSKGELIPQTASCFSSCGRASGPLPLPLGCESARGEDNNSQG